MPLLDFSVTQFGVFAGLIVYAVPQVIAATAPVGMAAIQLGTLVKLVRVLMLGPVMLTLSLLAHRLREKTDEPVPHVTGGDRPRPVALPVGKVVPWFIIAFLALATLHSLNLIPAAALALTATIANVLTILSMAALGLGVDVRVVARGRWPRDGRRRGLPAAYWWRQPGPDPRPRRALRCNRRSPELIARDEETTRCPARSPPDRT